MRCDICNGEFEVNDLIELDGRQVCGTCKPVVIQRLREGLPSAAAARAELTLRALLVSSWEIFRQHWIATTALCLLPAIPNALILMQFEPHADAGPREMGRYIGMAVLLETLIGVLAPLGIAYLVREHLEGRVVAFGRALRHALACWWPGMLTSSLSMIIIGLLLLALVVPGIIWMGYYSFAICTVSLRTRSGMRALQESKALVRGRWWRGRGSFGGVLFNRYRGRPAPRSSLELFRGCRAPTTCCGNPPQLAGGILSRRDRRAFLEPRWSESAAGKLIDPAPRSELRGVLDEHTVPN